MGQARAGFHYHEQTAGAGDVEPEFIRPHAKAGIADLRPRVPQNGRTI